MPTPAQPQTLPGTSSMWGRMECQQVQDSPCWVTRAASNTGHAQMQQWQATCLSKDYPCVLC